MSTDPYKVLGLSPNATPEEVKKAYRKLCGQHHPDKGGDAEKFKEIQAAYSRITEPEKHQQQSPFGPGFNHSGFGFQDAQDFFPIQFSLTLTLEEAFIGCTKKINIPGMESFNFEIPKGQLNDNVLQKFVKLSSGKQRRVICKIFVQKHPIFEIDGLNLRCQKEISLIEFYEGTTIQVKTLDNKVFNVKVIPNKLYQMVRLPKKGFSTTHNYFSEVGDLFIEIKVKLPELNEEQIAALKTIVLPTEVMI